MSGAAARCPGGDLPPDTRTDLERAEAWARQWSEDYPGHLQVLLAEYDRRGEELAEDVGVMRALRRHRDEAETALSGLRRVETAAREYVERLRAGSWLYPGHETELLTALASTLTENQELNPPGPP